MFGAADLLYTKPIPNNETFLPSPADLQGFVIVKVTLKCNLFCRLSNLQLVDLCNIYVVN